MRRCALPPASGTAGPYITLTEERAPLQTQASGPRLALSRPPSGGDLERQRREGRIQKKGAPSLKGKHCPVRTFPYGAEKPAVKTTLRRRLKGTHVLWRKRSLTEKWHRPRPLFIRGKEHTKGWHCQGNLGRVRTFHLLGMTG